MQFFKQKTTLLDWLTVTLLLGAAGFLTFRVTVTLDYNWNWSLIPQYLFRYDQEEGRWVSNYLVAGLLTTLRLSIWSGILASILGLIVAMARISPSLFLQLISRTYIELMRNLPPLVIIFIFYFFIADQFLPLFDIDAFYANRPEKIQKLITFLFADKASLVAFFSALVTLAVFESAYFAEIFRAGIQSISKHQWEAASAIGLNRSRTLYLIIFPQAIRRVMPPFAGQVISLIKDSAIVSVISIQELTYQGTQLMASTYMTIEVWITIAIMYIILTFPCSLFVSWLEQKVKLQSN